MKKRRGEGKWRVKVLLRAVVHHIGPVNLEGRLVELRLRGNEFRRNRPRQIITRLRLKRHPKEEEKNDK